MSTWTDYETFPPDVIETHSGRVVRPADLEPNPEDITIEDIAFSLTNLARFGGHTRGHVALHCLDVEAILRAEGESPLVRGAGLLHDGCEAFGLVDLPRPVKNLLPKYREMEARAMRAVYAVLLPGANILGPEDHATIKRADNASMLLEAQRGLPSQGSRWALTTRELLIFTTRHAPTVTRARRELNITGRSAPWDVVLREAFVSKYQHIQEEMEEGYAQ